MRWLRDRIAVVTQEAPLFNMTIRENMTLGSLHATDADIWDALEQAGAANFVMALPGQLDYVVGPRGSKLSGGQKQRISIAAAILRKSDILIFDEVRYFELDQNEIPSQAFVDLSILFRQPARSMVIRKTSFKNT